MFSAKSPLTVVGAVVALVLFLLTGVVMLAVTGEDLSPGAKQLIIGMLVTNILGLVPTILNLYKTEDVQHDMRNGVLKGKVKDAIQEMAADPTVPTVQIVTEDEVINDGRSGS